MHLLVLPHDEYMSALTIHWLKITMNELFLRLVPVPHAYGSLHKITKHLPDESLRKISSNQNQ